MNRIAGWFWRRKNEKELKNFFEKTTSFCFIECVKSTNNPLSQKEENCLRRCALQQLEALKEIEEAVEKKLSNGNS